MKYIILPALLLSTLFASAQGGAFTIKGNVEGWKGKDSVYLIYTEDHKTILDSLICIDGKFEFKGNIKQPVIVGVSARTRRLRPGFLDHRRFFLDKGTTIITAKDTLANATVKGSKTTADYENIQGQLEPLFTHLGQLRATAMATPKDQQSTPEFKALEKDYYASIDSIEKVRIAFIKVNPASFIALDALQNVGGGLKDYSKAGPLFEGLFPEVRNTPLGKETEHKLLIAKKTGIGAVLPAFESTDTAGNKLKLEDVVKKGKVTLVDFWASWCGPCRKENPNVIKAFTAFHDKGFNILSVSLDKTAEAWKKAIIKDGMPWYHVSELKYWDDPIAKMYDINGIPDNFLLDGDGKVVARGLRGEALYKKIESMVN
ncbi:MAG: AhpC/TSA family protein [Bacteroidetes bacterium]|nr:AhpC/TSA family protein [Bacteroidota bacterium]